MRFRVLLVDDEDEFVRMFSERFQCTWLNTETVLSADNALRTVQSEVPGVIVMDLRLPGMDGVEVLRRAQRAYPGAQVIILSGHCPSRRSDRQRSQGPSRRMEEPLDIDGLLDTLDRAYRDKMTDLVVAPTFSEAGQLSSALFITERD